MRGLETVGLVVMGAVCAAILLAVVSRFVDDILRWWRGR